MCSSAASPTDWEALFAFYPKISIRVRDVLSPNVLDDRFIGDHPELATKNPLAHRWRPQYLLFKWLNSCSSLREDFPLILASHSSNMRWARYEQMHVVLLTCPLTISSLSSSRYPAQSAADGRLRPPAATFWVLRDPHKVVLQVKSCVRRFPIMDHS